MSDVNPAIEIEKSYQGDKAIIYVHGRIDTQTSPEFQTYLEECFENDEKNLVLDFADLSYLSSAGLRAILYAKKKVDELKEGTESLSVVNVSDAVMEVFEMTGFTDLIKIQAKNSNN